MASGSLRYLSDTSAPLMMVRPAGCGCAVHISQLHTVRRCSAWANPGIPGRADLGVLWERAQTAGRLQADFVDRRRWPNDTNSVVVWTYCDRRNMPMTSTAKRLAGIAAVLFTGAGLAACST